MTVKVRLADHEVGRISIVERARTAPSQDADVDRSAKYRSPAESTATPAGLESAAALPKSNMVWVKSTSPNSRSTVVSPALQGMPATARHTIDSTAAITSAVLSGATERHLPPSKRRRLG
jgi:hypothetical protein